MVSIMEMALGCRNPIGELIMLEWLLNFGHYWWSVNTSAFSQKPTRGEKAIIWRLVGKYDCWKWCWLLEKKSMTMVSRICFVCIYNISYNDHGKTLQLFTLNLTHYKQISLEQFRPERNFWWTRKWRFKMCMKWIQHP